MTRKLDDSPKSSKISRSIVRKDERKARLVEFRGGCCEDCKQSFDHAVYDFHHIEPKLKLFKLSGADLANRSWTSVTEEAAKCVMLCANCHRMRHK